MKEKNHFPWQNNDIKERIKRSLELIKKSANPLFIELFSIDDKDNSNTAETSPLKGAIIAVKDLFDVKGYKTRAGSVFLNNEPVAQKDADVVASLRNVGAVLLGHSNMTELAYSGLGINPHYGTPEIPNQIGRIAGGSTSGGAAAVAAGIVDIALGTDTGGSLRIPAAFCGVTGFKPSQNSLSRKGCLPLSESLDSVGVIAKTIESCELAWQVMSGNQQKNTVAQKTSFIIPTNFGLDNLDTYVEEGFFLLVKHLKQQGIEIENKALPFLDEYKKLAVWQFSAVESMQYYASKYPIDDIEMDPRVKSRMDRAHSVSATEFQQTKHKRQTIIRQFEEEEKSAFLLMPTVAITAPKIESLSKNENYDSINLLCLRNTSLANVLNGCSISLPYQYKGENIGLMLVGANDKDNELISLAKRLEMELKEL